MKTEASLERMRWIWTTEDGGKDQVDLIFKDRMLDASSVLFLSRLKKERENASNQKSTLFMLDSSVIKGLMDMLIGLNKT